MAEQIKLDMLPKEAERWMKVIDGGNLGVARSNNEFLYVYSSGGEYQLFIHSPGSISGGRRTMPKDEKGTAMVSNLAKVADSLFSVEFESDMELFGVMATTEEAILASFPDRKSDDDGDIEFIIPGKSEAAAEEEKNDDSRPGVQT